MSHEFAYTCPHCNETIRITDDVMGGVVDCPVCENPFKVSVPTAQPADPNKVNGNTPGVDRPDRAEGELKTVHPAMFRTKPMVFIGYWALVVLGLAGIVLALLEYTFLGFTFQAIVCGLIALAGGVLLGIWWLKKQFTTLTVTTKRTILRHGILAKKTSEVQHDDVRNIQVDQTVFDRMFGVGSLAVSSSGQDDLEILVRGIPQPDAVAEMIRDMQ